MMRKLWTTLYCLAAACLLAAAPAAWAQTGDTCEDAIVIGSLPFTQAGASTVGLADDYSSSPCNDNYIGGNDIVFSYTPAADQDVVFSFSNASTDWDGYHLFDACPDAAEVNCVAGETTSASGGSFNAALTAGQTYYLVASTFPSPNDVTFDITVEEASGPIAGDNCDNAIDLAAETSPFSGNTSDNGIFNDFDFEDSDNGVELGTGNDMIFFIDVPDGQTLEIGQASNDYDSEHMLRIGDTCPGDQMIYADDDTDTDIVRWPNTTGQTQRAYWIQAGHGSSAGPFDLQWQLFDTPAAVSGDDCANAIDLATQTSPLAGTTVGANNNFTFCSLGGSADLVYFIDVPAGNQLTIGETDNDFNSRATLRLGDNCPGDTEVQCTGTDEETFEYVNFSEVTERLYYIIGGQDVQDGTFTLEWSLEEATPPIAGDNCSNAIDLAAETSPFSGSTAAEGVFNDFDFCSMGSANDMIFYIDVPVGQTLTIGQDDNDYDSRHSLRTGGMDCPGDTELACFDGSEFDPLTYVNNGETAERVWWVQSGWSTSEGAFTLSWSLEDTPEPAPGDNCSNAIDLAAETSPYSGDTSADGIFNDFDFEFADEFVDIGNSNDMIFFIDVPVGFTLQIGQESNEYDSEHIIRIGDTCPGEETLFGEDSPDDAVFNYSNETEVAQRIWWIQAGASTNSGAFVLDWLLVETPDEVPGDNCENALDLSTLTAPYTASTAALGVNNDFDFCSMGSSNDMVFFIDVPANSAFTITPTDDDYDTRHSLRTGGACPGDTELECVDDPDSTPFSYLNESEEVVRVYYIQAGFSSNAGEFTIDWTLEEIPEAVPGNDCETAIDLSLETSPFMGSTAAVGVTNELDLFDPVSFVDIGSTNELVFYIDVPAGFTLEIGQTANSYDSQHMLRMGETCPGDMLILASDDPDVATIRWDNETGEQQRLWWIQGGYESSTGPFTLAWEVFETPLPQPGESCETPLAIETLPFAETATNTADFFDTLDGNGCFSNSYLDGDEKVYTYAPAADEVVNVVLTNITDNYTGVQITDGCPDSSPSCIAFASNGFSTDDLRLDRVSLTGGTTYYMVVSTWPSPQSTTYDLTFEPFVNFDPTVADGLDDVRVLVGADPQSIDLGPAFADANPDEVLTYTASSDNAGVVTVSVDGSDLDLTFVAEGSATVTVTATDIDGAFVSTTFEVTVAATNAAPTSIAIGTTNTDENLEIGSVYFTLEGSDPDEGDLLSYALVSGEGDDDNGSFEVVGNEVLNTEVFDFETQSSYSIRVAVIDAQGESFEASATLTLADVNEEPTDISIDNDAVDESIAAGATIGAFSTTDEDADETATYAFASGEGDEDNAAFDINGANLDILASPDFETQSSYSVRIVVTDAFGNTYEEAFTITINDVNEAPAGLALDNASLDENAGLGAAVGSFSATDEDAGDDALVFALAEGEGDTDNARFALATTGELTAAVDFNFEDQATYSIRVSVSDDEGASSSEAFTISVNDVNEAPTAVNGTDLAAGEDVSVGTAVATLGASDVDADDTFTFAFVSGEGDDDNGQFAISGNEIQTTAALDFETQNSFTVRVEATDSGDLTATNFFTFTITNVNEAPTDLQLSANSVAENGGANVLVGDLSAADVDAGDALTFTLVAGEGDADNASFTIDGTELRTAADFDFETQDSYSVRVAATDNGGLAVEESFTITVNDVNETPVEAAAVSDQTFGLVAGEETIVADIAAVFSDPEGDALTFTATTDETDATVTLNADNSVSFSVATSFSGSFTVTMTATDGEFTATSTFTVTVSTPTGVRIDDFADALTLAPVPVSDRLTVSLRDGSRKAVTLTVHDLNGKRVESVTLDKRGETLTHDFDASALAPGVYLLEVTQGARKAVRRFVKQ